MASKAWNSKVSVVNGMYIYIKCLKSETSRLLFQVSDDVASDSGESLPTGSVCLINRSLIESITRQRDFNQIVSLDLHLHDGNLGKIRKIENLGALSRLRLLNLSYNAVTKIEGLQNLSFLQELNLADNAIERVMS